MHIPAIAPPPTLRLVLGCAAILGCAAAMTPDARLRNELFWNAAVECESRYRTLHLDRIDTGGGITLHADAESRSELQSFTRCYRQAVNARIEQRRQAGLPIPEELTVEPSVDLD